MDPLQFVISLVVFAAVFAVVWLLLCRPASAAQVAQHRQIVRALDVDRATVFENAALAPLMEPAVRLGSRLGELVPSLRRRVWQDLSASGNIAGYSVDQYVGLSVLSCVLGGLLGLGLNLLLAMNAATIVVPIFMAAGFWLPLTTLRSSATARVSRISKQLPYTLDLVALVMAAGSNFTEAVETLIRDNPDEDLNQELSVCLAEIRFGSTRAEAMTGLAERVPLESLRSAVAAVNQAEKLGTPLASILKMQADMLRMQRGVRAEKMSASASLRILIPSMMILIAVVTIVFAPMLIRYINQGSLLG
jgi:tight adherence protein C